MKTFKDLTNYLLKSFDDMDIEERKKILLLNMIFAVGSLLLVVFGIVTLLNGYLTLAYVDLSIAVLSITGFIYFRKTQNYKIASFFCITLMFLLFTYLFATGGVEKSGFAFSMILPLFLHFLFGTRKGLITSVLYLGVLYFIAYFPDLPLRTIDVSQQFMNRYTAAYIAILLVAFNYENITNIISNNLRNQQRELEEIIDESMRVEEALRISEEKYRDLTEKLPIGIYRTTPNGKILIANSKLIENLGYDNFYELQHVSVYDLYVDPNVRNEILNKWKETEETVECEYQLKRKDGSIIWVKDAFNAVKDHNGDILYTEGTSEDITAKKLTQEALQKSENQFKFVVRKIPGLIWTTDKDMNFQMAYGASLEHFGLEESDNLNKSVFEIFETENPSALPVRMHYEALKGGKCNYELEYKDKSYKAYLEPFRNIDGEIIGILGIAFDISDQKKAAEVIKGLNEELESKVEERTAQLHDALNELRKANKDVAKALEKEKELNTLKTRFISMVSHQYRTPLTVILSASFLLEKFFDINDKEEFMNNIHKIQASIKEMVELLENVLFIGKEEAGKIEVKPAEFDPVERLENIIREVEVIDRQNHEFEFEHPRAGLKIESDPSLFQQIFSNLISNAAKYSEPGSKIHVSMKNGNSSLKIKVKDSGIGIPEDEMKHIFEPFHRFSNAGNISGTGLGLTIVKKCADTLGADIAVSSKLNHGTEFHCELPVKFEVRNGNIRF